MSARYEYAVLLSHASETTIPGLVIPVPGALIDANAEARRTASATGTKALIVRREADGPWLTGAGLTPQAALDKGAADGWRGWVP
jgi:hypothetical protein